MPKSAPKVSQKGFSLVEMIIGLFVMSLVITGGLVGLSQANLLSEKANDQALADFLLRVEIERLRSMDWAEIETLRSRITTYENTNSGQRYPSLQSITANDLAAAGMTAEVQGKVWATGTAADKNIFHITLNWQDATGRSHSESRVCVVTEGGFSAQN